METIKFLGHRGNQAFGLENSSEAIIDCSDNQLIDGAEFDIRPTKDNAIVIAHNPYIYNLNKKAYICDCTLKDLEKCYFRISYKDSFEQNIMGLISKDKYYLNQYLKLHKLKSKISTFENVIDKFSSDKEMLIEIKMLENEYENIIREKFIENLLNYLDLIKYKLFTIQSFNLDVLKEIKEKRNNVNIVGLFNRSSHLKSIKDHLYLDGYSLEYCLANKNIVDDVIKFNKALYTWDNKLTANHLKKVKQINKTYQNDIENGSLKYKVISDYPEKIKREVYKG